MDLDYIFLRIIHFTPWVVPSPRCRQIEMFDVPQSMPHVPLSKPSDRSWKNVGRWIKDCSSFRITDWEPISNPMIFTVLGRMSLNTLSLSMLVHVKRIIELSV